MEHHLTDAFRKRLRVRDRAERGPVRPAAERDPAPRRRVATGRHAREPARFADRDERGRRAEILGRVARRRAGRIVAWDRVRYNDRALLGRVRRVERGAVPLRARARRRVRATAILVRVHRL